MLHPSNPRTNASERLKLIMAGMTLVYVLLLSLYVVSIMFAAPFSTNGNLNQTTTGSDDKTLEYVISNSTERASPQLVSSLNADLSAFNTSLKKNRLQRHRHYKIDNPSRTDEDSWRHPSSDMWITVQEHLLDRILLEMSMSMSMDMSMQDYTMSMDVGEPNIKPSTRNAESRGSAKRSPRGSISRSHMSIRKGSMRMASAFGESSLFDSISNDMKIISGSLEDSVSNDRPLLTHANPATGEDVSNDPPPESNLYYRFSPPSEVTAPTPSPTPTWILY